MKKPSVNFHGRQRFIKLFLSYKENAKRVSSAVRGNGAACAGDMYLTEGSSRFYEIVALHIDLLVASRVGYENAVKLDVGVIADSVCNVGLKNL